MSPEIRQGANRFIQQIFPPRYEAEARSLATLGNAAIPYLRSANITNPSARTFAIETLCRIGSREAMDAIVEYARANVPTDTHAIGRAIERFDPETYAETVLTEVRSDLHLSVQDTRHLRAISNLPRVSTLVVQKARLDDGALSTARTMPALRRLEVRWSQSVGSLDWTARVQSLRNVAVVDSQGIEALTRIGPTALWTLHLANLSLAGVNWRSVLQNMPNLRVLSLVDVKTREKEIPANAVSRLFNLNTLAVSGDVHFESLKFLADNEKLSRLKLGSPLGFHDMEHLEKSASIRRLDVNFVQELPSAAVLVKLALRHLGVGNAPHSLLSRLNELDGLQSLELRNTTLASPDFLSVAPSVKKLTFTECTFNQMYTTPEHARTPPRFAGVEQLIWRSGTLVNLEFLRDMPSLRHLDIEDNGSISSLEALDHVPAGCYVRLVGTRWGLEGTPVHQLGLRCHLVYEPDYDSDTFEPGFWIDYGG